MVFRSISIRWSACGWTLRKQVFAQPGAEGGGVNFSCSSAFSSFAFRNLGNETNKRPPSQETVPASPSLPSSEQ